METVFFLTQHNNCIFLTPYFLIFLKKIKKNSMKNYKIEIAK